MLYLSREEVYKLLTHDMAIQACEEGLKLEAANKVWTTARIHYDLGQKGKIIRFMPAAGNGFVGLRVYTPGKGGGAVMYILWDRQNGNPLAMMDAMAIRD